MTASASLASECVAVNVFLTVCGPLWHCYGGCLIIFMGEICKTKQVRVACSKKGGEEVSLANEGVSSVVFDD